MMSGSPGTEVLAVPYGVGHQLADVLIRHPVEHLRADT